MAPARYYGAMQIWILRTELGLSPEQEGSALGQLSADVEDGGRPCRSWFQLHEIQV